MKRYEKKLPKKLKFSPSSKLNFCNFQVKCVKGLRVHKIVKEINFKRVFREEELKKKNFLRQAFENNLTITLVFM